MDSVSIAAGRAGRYNVSGTTFTHLADITARRMIVSSALRRMADRATAGLSRVAPPLRPGRGTLQESYDLGGPKPPCDPPKSETGDKHEQRWTKCPGCNHQYHLINRDRQIR
jgi:hypothetical protein